MTDRSILLTLFQLVLKDGTQLALENIALRQQLAVYKRTVKRPKIEDRDRIFWLSVMGMLKEWKEALVFVYHESRTHLSLGGNAPVPRETATVGEVISTPVLGGLHHRYSRSAA